MLMTRPRTRWRRALDRVRVWAAHPLAVPALLALLMLAIGAQVACVFTIPSWSNDEPAHLGYIAALADGRLPTIDTPSGFVGRDVAHDHIWTANHPPAFHLLMVPVWWLTSGDVGTAVVAMRLANAAGFAAWLFLVALVVRELVPGRPTVTALATVVALAPTLALRSGFLINDGLGSSAALVLMLMTVRMLRADSAGGFTRRRLLVAALAGTVAAGTRAPGVLLVVACFVAVLIVGARREGWLRGSAYAAVLGGVPALLTGWFYLRNYRLYGDFTGQDALLDKFERLPVNSVGDVFALRTVQETLSASPWFLFTLVVLAPPCLVLAVRRGWRPDAAWSLLIGHALLTAVNVGTFIAAGGGFHDRYFMQVMPVLAAGAALAMLQVGRWRVAPGTDRERRDRRVAAGWSVLLLGWLGGTLWWMQHRYSFYFWDLHAHHPVGGPLPALLTVVAAALGIAAVAAMLLRAEDRVS